MISHKELDENMLNLRPIGLPSPDEIAHYQSEGLDDKNALEYEKAYISLIEQVKDKSHEEQVKFLMEHMNELRNMVDLFSSTDDFFMFKDNKQDDEILANILIHRYENNISVLDDEDCCLSREVMFEAIRRTNDRISSEKAAAFKKFIAEHPEEYRRQQEEKLRHCEQLAEELREALKDVHLTNENLFDSFK